MISAISNSLAWSAVQVTLLALFVLGLSWVLQKLRISLGSTAPLAALVGTLIVTAVSLIPLQMVGKSAQSQSVVGDVSPLSVNEANIQAAAAQLNQADSLDWINGLAAGEAEMAAPLPGKSTGMSHGILTRSVELFGQFREWIRDNANLVLAFIVCGMMIGLVRLWIGLHAVRRFERNSIPIRDRDIRELLDTIRAELSCLAPIELRECGGLRTAATVGVRRPRILLPSEFRDWTHEQRVAVLAHEVAHIVRKDYSNWLVAQFCTIVHYLNPAVQLLANRLRLEQELAADAQAARAAGGRMSYLGVLAEMALTERESFIGMAGPMFFADPWHVSEENRNASHWCIVLVHGSSQG